MMMETTSAEQPLRDSEGATLTTVSLPRGIRENMSQHDKTILVIDDDAALLKIYARILGKHGYRADTAETGREALEKLRNLQYDAILIDVRLPDINGIELLQKIHAQMPKAIKIMVTGFPSPEDRARAQSSGAAAYLGKPVRIEELLKILEEKLKPAQKKTTDPAGREN